MYRRIRGKITAMKKESITTAKVALKLAAFLAAILMAKIISDVLITSLLVEKLTTPALMLFQGFLAFILCFLVVCLFQKKIDEETIVSMGLSIKGRKKDIFLGLLWGAVCLAVGFACIAAVAPSNLSIELQPLRITYLIAGLVSFILTAFIEEMIFRGYFLRKLLGAFSKHTAILISAAFFSLVHALNSGYDVFALINIFMVSIFFAQLYVYTNNLWLIVGFHFSWNWVQALLGFNVSGVEYPGILNLNFVELNHFNGKEFGFEGSYICTIILLLSILYMAKVQKRREILGDKMPCER